MAKAMHPSFGPTRLVLQGFQTFAEPTEVTFGRLTFLFGPNSSGKSAVEDAMALVESLTKIGARRHLEDVSRHWRKTGPLLKDYVPKMSLRYAELSDRDVTAMLNAAFRGAERPPYDPAPSPRAVEVYFEFSHDPAGYEDGNPFPNFGYSIHCALSIDGECLFECRDNEYIGMNFGHPALARVASHADLEQLSERWPEFVTFHDSWLGLTGNWVGVRRWLAGSLRDGPLRLLTHSSSLKDGKISWPTYLTQLDIQQIQRLQSGPASDLMELVQQVWEIWDKGWPIVGRTLRFLTDVVPASRKVPTIDDLTHLVGIVRDDMLSAVERKFGNGTYSALAESFASSLPTWNWEMGTTEHYFEWLGEAVNRALSDHLFIDNGYRIAGECRVILRPDELAGFVEKTLDTDMINFPVLVRLHLVDARGQPLDFADVGSGLGYVLPVLCSVLLDKPGTVLVQQPELHLHPALQAALGDVFLEATAIQVPEESQVGQDAGNAKRLVIETHSEHLLLRILRRIRQTMQHRASALELEVDSEDVHVLYFAPDANGTTTVKRLRISPSGDFLDRWPRGFFTEREEELFDE